jgi:hypothetical protein
MLQIKPTLAILLSNVQKPRSTMNPKRDNFVRLAEARVARAIESISKIGNLSNRSNYSYNDQDVQKIIRALQNEIAALKTQFSSKSGSSGREFKLGE